jgi:uncharacterized metal-binding protein (TIGR02443 family)
MRRQFIAGAICPQCQQLDKLYIERVEETDYRVCVRCGFREPRPEAPKPQSDPASVVRILPAPTTDRGNL